MFLFYWLIAIMPLDEHPLWGKALVGTLTVVKLVGILAMAMALRKLFSGGRAPRLLQSPQAKWYLAFLLVQATTFVFHAGELASGTGAFSHVISVAMLFVMVPVMADSYPRLNRALLVAIGSIGFASLYAVRQGQKYGSGFRASGSFNDTNEYALIVGLWMPLAFLWIFSRRPAWERWFCAGALATALVGIVLAASRGSSLALAIGVFYLICRSPHRWRNLMVVSAAVVPLLLVFPHSVVRRLRDPGYGEQVASEARLISWRAGLKMIQANPLTGVGLHNFKPRSADYQSGESMLVVKLAHNTYIEIAAELGIAGLITLLGTLAATLYSLERSRRRALRLRAGNLATLALGLQAGILQFSIGAFFVTAWWEKMAWLMIFLSMVVHRTAVARMARHERRQRLLKVAA